MSTASGDHGPAQVPPPAPSPLEVAAFGDDAAAWAASVPPSANAVGPAGALDAARLSQAARVDAVVAVERHLAWLQARQIRAVAALAGPAPPGGDPDLYPDPPRDKLNSDQRRERADKEWIKEDLRAALGESAISAGQRVHLARELTGRMQPTLSALEHGRITMRHVRYLVSALSVHDHDTTATVQDAVLPGPSTPLGPPPEMARFRRRIRRAILNADPRTAERRRADALAERRVGTHDHGDGTTSAFALLSTEGAATLMAALNLIASQHDPDDSRTTDQRRADALIQLARDALTGYRDCPHCHTGSARPVTTSATGSPPRHPAARHSGLAPAVNVTIALSTLLGLDEQAGELNGEPIPATLAHHLATDHTGTWRRILTDDLGHLIDYGHSTYRPPTNLARHIAARDRTCIFPTCNRRASTCELDHTRDWADGGPTNEHNLAALCSRHHHSKHETGWRYQRLDNGDILWRSPHGHTYRKPAATYPIDHTNDPNTQPDSQEHPATDPDPPITHDRVANKVDDQPPF